MRYLSTMMTAELNQWLWRKDVAPESLLAFLYLERGCCRVPDPARRRDAPRDYKKGYEVRLVLETDRQARRARWLVERAGLTAGKAYDKGSRVVLPVYGRKSLETFEYWLMERGLTRGTARHRPRRSRNSNR